MPRLLLVDDDAFLLQMIGGKFAAGGFEVLYAHDGEEGLAMLAKLKPDIVVSDYRMPNMDGLGFGARAKANPETAGIPIVFLTSEDFSPEVQASLKALGIADYMHKSLDFPEILARVKKALGL